MSRSITLTLLINLLLPCLAVAGEWRVVPIRIDLGKDHRSDLVRLINEGTEKVNLQVEATEWTQNDQGEDRYDKSEELIFFPKILTIEPKEERVLRIGIRSPAVQREKAYRLFIEEIPEANKTEATQVSINIRFGLPVFVEPLQETATGTVTDFTLKAGKVGAGISNSGNTHFRINKLIVHGLGGEGQKVFSHELQGWYLLAGSSRRYTLELPEEDCRKAATLQLEVDTDKTDLRQSLRIEPDQCRP